MKRKRRTKTKAVNDHLDHITLRLKPRIPESQRAYYEQIHVTLYQPEPLYKMLQREINAHVNITSASDTPKYSHEKES